MALDYFPWWLDKLAADVTGQGAFIDGGPIRGPEAVRSVVLGARDLYEFQDFAYYGDFGDNGFIEQYSTRVNGQDLDVVVTVTRNAAGECQKLVVNHSPRNAMLAFSRAMHHKFADSPLAGHFLADAS